MLSPSLYSSTENRSTTQLGFDLQQTVVLGYPFASTHGTGLYLSAPHGYCEISHESIFSLTRTMGNNKAPSCLTTQMNGCNGFRDGTDLVEFDQRSVARLLSDTTGNILRIGD